MSQPLSAKDRSAITAERGPVNMALGAALIVEDGPGLTHAEVCRRIDERIHLVPRYRQRFKDPDLRSRRPDDAIYHTWTDDENFDVRVHVRHGALPAPAGDAELAEWIGQEFSRRLDRSRSPWEIHVLRGLSDGRAAIVLKMHHAMVDGLAALGIGMVLLDTEAEPARVLPGEAAAQGSSREALHRYLVRLTTTSATRSARFFWGVADRYLLAPGTVEADVRRTRDVLAAMLRNRASAPRLPLNRTITANRAYAFGQADLRTILAARRRAGGGTVNDAVLAAVTGMLRRYLAAAGIDADGLSADPVALVPVALRRSGGDGTDGNRFSIVFIDLPVRETDPLRRIRLVKERTERLRASADVLAGALIIDSVGFVPPVVTTALSSLPSLPTPTRTPSARIANNLVVSNLPGPRMPLYFNGSTVLAAYPVVPLNPSNQGLTVGIITYNRSVHWGLLADLALDPPVAVAAEALRGEFDAFSDGMQG